MNVWRPLSGKHASRLLGCWLFLAGWLLLLLLPVPQASAQDSATGAIAGRVTGPAGAAVGGAAVDLLDGNHRLLRSAIAGTRGEFSFAQLPPGTYLLRIDSPPFGSSEQAAEVQVGSTTELQTRLCLATVTATVEVSEDEAAADQLETGRAATAAATLIHPAELAQLPLNGRQWQGFLLLAPTTSVSSEAADGPVSFRGLPETQNSSGIDGVSGDQSLSALPRGAGAGTGEDAEEESETGGGSGASRGYAVGGGSGRHAGAAYTFSQEAVREFRVSAHGYSAAFGHAAGGVVSAVSRGGTARLRGTAFFNLRDSAWAAKEPFAVATSYRDGTVTSSVVKPHDLRQQFGGSLGGPLLRNRIYGFYVFDGQRRGFPAISSPGYAGFYQLTATQGAVLGRRGVTPAKVNAALNYLSSLSGELPRRADQTVHFGRLDWQASPRDRVTIEGNRARWSSPAGVRSGTVVNRGLASLGDSYVRADSGVLAWTWSHGGHLANDLRLQLAHNLQYEQPQTPLPQEAAIGPGGDAPEIVLGPGGFVFGTPAGLGRRAYPDERRTEAADTLTYARGRSLLQLGVDWSALRDRVDAVTNPAGTFSYDSGYTGGRAGGLVDWITDYTFGVHSYPNGACPSITAKIHLFCFRSFTESFGEQDVSFNTQEWAGFVQETWRVRPSLTLSAGVRYEYELLPLPQRPNGALDTSFGASGATGIFPEDRNNAGPRVALAWQPLGEGRGTLRLGYGLFYGRLPGITLRSALVNTALPTSTRHIRITPSTETVCPQASNQGFGYVCAYTAAPPAAVASTTSATVFSRRFRLPAVQQGTASVERELRGGLALSATYLLDLDRQLPNSVDRNIAPATAMARYQIQGGSGHAGLRDGQTFAVPLYTARIDPAFGPVTEIVSNGNGSYNALTVEAHERLPSGLSLRASWTWSKALDFVTSSGAVPRTNGQFDPYNVRYDKAVSAFNRPYKLVGSAIWRPRVGAREAWARRLGNGWSAAAIVYATSGRPYSYDIFGGTRLTGGHESINGAGGAVYLPTVGRNTLRMPETINADLRVGRAVPLHDRLVLRLEAEVFNLPNHRNLSTITQRAFLPGVESNGLTPLVFQDANAIAAEGLNVQPFGTYTSATADLARPRQVETGLRLEF